jgi:hypothetical protein
MSLLAAVDPGNLESAYLLYDTGTGCPVEWRKAPNAEVLLLLDASPADALAIEMVQSFGMAVGREVFDTCVWIGRFAERWERSAQHVRCFKVFRKDVKLHLCRTNRATDSNIRQALIDRYGPGKEIAIGRKASPGPLFGISGDCWSALAIAVTVADAAETETI